MKNILLISGHPNLENSVGNKAVIEEFKRLCPQAEIRLLDELYGDYRIDVSAEQSALTKADIIIWQFPFYWYYMPALLKKWLDDVFTHGFAHGSKGKSLEGRHLVLSFTTGASADEYQHGHAMNFEVEEFLNPFRQTAALCGLILEKPVYSNSMMYVPGVSSDEDKQAVKDRALNHAKRLFDLVKTI
ncbi:MAG: NAD(P)H-dependent oxidoreductase [Succinivibrio sp.]|nr:NAD(P)H-dependent oxidoreductase [Succinivibrio sp.]